VSRSRRVTLNGIGVSPGIAIGHVHLVDRRKVRYPTHHIPPRRMEPEVERLEVAFAEAVSALEALRSRVVDQGGGDHTPILDAHLLMLQDPMLTDGARRHITEDRKCAEWAVRSTVREIKKRFDNLGDSYFRERRSDVDFVGERVLQALSKDTDRKIERIPEDAVVVAHDLSPADTLGLLKKKVRAFVTEVGGATSHTAILAHALEIPAVVGCAGVVEQAGRKDDVIVDGNSGEVLLHPSNVLRAKYRGIAKRRELLVEQIDAELGEPCVTTDGHDLPLLANIELEDEVESAVAHGATGVGLYRTEFLFLNRRDLPSEEDHAAAYGSVLDHLEPGMPAVFRTFDLGSDKMSTKVATPKEENPALGLRATRLGLAHSSLLRQQLRGMLIATANQEGSIMFPMIGGVSELRRVKEVLYEEMDVLESEGVPVWREVPVGIMVELPSAVWVADRLAGECDFFSVGTNDLIQYSLAIDRGNEHVAYLYHPLHLSNLRAIEHVVRCAKDADIPVSLCGEMAADIRYLAICAALGFTSLSMPMAAIPRAKYGLRRLALGDAKALLAECLALCSVEEIEERVHGVMHEWLPELVAAPS
jgi:phosphotransferase system enzyme I (PtsI)